VAKPTLNGKDCKGKPDKNIENQATPNDVAMVFVDLVILGADICVCVGGEGYYFLTL
jgi:hypothetical protein